MVVTPALAAIRIIIHILIQPSEGGIPERIRSVNTHLRIQRSNIECIGGSAPGAQGRIQFLDGLGQEERLPASLTQRNHVAFHRHRLHFSRTGGDAIEHEGDSVLSNRRQTIEILLPLAGRKHCSRKDRHRNVNLFHDLQSSEIKNQNRTPLRCLPHHSCGPGL